MGAWHEPPWCSHALGHTQSSPSFPEHWTEPHPFLSHSWEHMGMLELFIEKSLNLLEFICLSRSYTSFGIWLSEMNNNWLSDTRVSWHQRWEPLVQRHSPLWPIRRPRRELTSSAGSCWQVTSQISQVPPGNLLVSNKGLEWPSWGSLKVCAPDVWTFE